MSQPVPATARPRPQAVTIAGILLMVVAVVAMIDAIVGISMAGKVADAMRDVYRADASVAAQADTVATFARAGGTAVGILYLIGAVGFVVLAMLDLRGRQIARVITWVVAGLGILCCGCGAIGNVAQNAFQNVGGNSSNGPDPEALRQAVDRATPGWYGPLSITVAVIGVLCLIAVVILLAVPASNAYFKPPPPPWQPPVGGDPAYPTYPGPVGGPEQPGGQVGWSERDRPPQPPRDDEPRG